MTRRGFFSSLFAAAVAPALARLAPAKPVLVRKPPRYTVREGEPFPLYCFGDYAPEPSITVRITRAYDANKQLWITRMDVLYAIAPLQLDSGGLPMPAHPAAIDPGASQRVLLAG